MIFASVFQSLIVIPIFNLLVLIYALLPGHDFGLSIIIFTIVVRLLMWPLVKKQLHQTKAMRKLQPELKRIKKEAAGNRQKEQMMLLELYKERGINPFGSLPVIIIQFIILIGLFYGLRHVIEDPRAIIDNAYAWIANTGWLQTLAQDISKFDQSLLGIVDLSKAAIGDNGVYIPALIIVTLSAAVQFLTSRQLLPKQKDARSLKQILKEAGEGKTSDQTEVSAAVGRGMLYIIPGLIFLFTVHLPAALSLYWFIGGLVAYFQQGRVLSGDEEEMEEIAEKNGDKPIIEGEIVEKPKEKKQTSSSKKKQPAKKRRKR